ncbi:hypothetical protein ACEXQD_04720 [Herbiconiux sp. P15]|uniref:hypothetical protein n=1 Tax=Herbiconiux liukaitaii TaxID=3342799 RepID=UPI0035B84DF2
MTDTLAPALTWRRTPQGLWVASTDDRPMGIVTEKSPHRFVATGRTGRDLGTHRTLDEARAALEAAL